VDTIKQGLNSTTGKIKTAIKYKWFCCEVLMKKFSFHYILQVQYYYTSRKISIIIHGRMLEQKKKSLPMLMSHGEC
jgi:hypothetical protein